VRYKHTIKLTRAAPASFYILAGTPQYAAKHFVKILLRFVGSVKAVQPVIIASSALPPAIAQTDFSLLA
jgi:hypothetical protein